MAKKKEEEQVKQGLAQWMGTYGDMVTLLLCFFVLLFASAEVDVAKYNQIASSFAQSTLIIMPEQTNGMLDAIGNGIMDAPEVKGESNKEHEADAQEEIRIMSEKFKTYFAENNISNMVEIEKNDRDLTLIFKDGILFDSGSADIKSESIGILSKVIDEIATYVDNDIKIEGHTDDLPINTFRFPNNWYLSSARSISVATYFIENKNFIPDRISTEGYGEYKPKVPNDTPKNRSINRRVEIKIISKYYSNNDL